MTLLQILRLKEPRGPIENPGKWPSGIKYIKWVLGSSFTVSPCPIKTLSSSCFNSHSNNHQTVEGEHVS